MTDHYDEAKRLLEATERFTRPDSDSPMYAIEHAQAHATLALVDAQREANLIQLAQVPTGMLTYSQKTALREFFAAPNPCWEEELKHDRA